MKKRRKPLIGPDGEVRELLQPIEIGLPTRADAMGRAGRERVEQDFTWPRAIGQLTGWLREAAG